MTIDLDAPAAAPRPLRPRRRRAQVIGAASVVAAVVLVALVLGATPPPSRAPLPDNLPGRLPWITALVDAPPRGSVAADTSFVRDLADRMADVAETTAFEAAVRRPPGARRARVLFAEDIDDHRIALVALLRPDVTDAIRRYALVDLVWLSGPRGATASTLVDVITAGASSAYHVEPVAPFALAGFGEDTDPVWVGIAPPSCQIATAPATDLTAWRPIGSYLVRRPRDAGPEYWRVTCDGAVREERPAPRPRVGEHELDVVLAHATGEPSRVPLADQISQLTSRFGSAVVTPPEVVWSGHIAYSPIAFDAREVYYDSREAVVNRRPAAPIEATVTIITARYARGGFISALTTIIREGPTTIWTMDEPTFRTRVHPGAPDALVAIRVERWRGQVLILAPALATAVRILDGETIVDQSAVTGDQPVMLVAGVRAPAQELRVEALDAAGTVIAATELATTDVAPDHTTAWE